MEAFPSKKEGNAESLTKVQYWDSRYKEEEHVEWLLDCEQLGKRVEEAAAASGWGKDARILHLGCGTSLLPQHLHKLGYTRVVNIDNSPVCVSSMSQRFPHLNFKQMDLNDLQYGKSVFDMVVEKSTLDTLISDCSLQEGRLLVERGLQEVKKVLRPDGVFLSVSLLSPSEHSAILSPLGGKVKLERLKGGEDQVDCTVAMVFLENSNGVEGGQYHVGGSVIQDSFKDQHLIVEDELNDEEESYTEDGAVSDDFKDLVKSMIS